MVPLTHPVGIWSPSPTTLQCRPILDHHKPSVPLTIKADALCTIQRGRWGPRKEETCPRP